MAKQKPIPEEFKQLIEELANALAGPALADQATAFKRAVRSWKVAIHKPVVKSFFNRMHRLEQRVAELENDSIQMGQHAAANVNAKSIGRAVAENMGISSAAR